MASFGISAVKAVNAIDGDQYNTGANNGSGFDCAGYTEALVIVSVGVMSASATLDVKIQESSDDGASDTYADVTGAAFTQFTQAGGDGDEIAFARVVLGAGRERYLRAVGTVGTAQVFFDVSVLLFGCPDAAVSGTTLDFEV